MKTYKNYSDTELILAFQESQEANIFGEIYARYYEPVFLYCNKILKDRDQALDLTQDLFIKISDKIVYLKNPATFVKWIFRVAHNGCMDLLRRKKRFQSLSNEVFNEMHLVDDNSEEYLEYQNELTSRMNKAMDQLSPMDKELLIRKYYSSTSVLELMEDFGLSQSAVKMRLSRTKKKVRSYCAELELAYA